jgi:hypothetical protein
MNFKKTILVAVAGLTVALAATTGASAETRWQYHHPRRTEVIDRLHNQYRRIRDERMEGEINGREARYLHREDRSIFRQEQRDARFDRGHITRGEQHYLNHEENGVSGQIGR